HAGGQPQGRRRGAVAAAGGLVAADEGRTREGGWAVTSESPCSTTLNRSPAMNAPEAWADLPNLLHDARLFEVRWGQGKRSGADLSFNCLRRATDGTDLPDRGVELRLAEVRVVGVGYDGPGRPFAFIV